MGRKADSYAGGIKDGIFNLTDISAYFLHKSRAGESSLLSDQTCSDLGMEELFTFADRTVSRVGQQYLYHTLRTISQAAGEIEQNEEIIGHLQTDSNLRNRLAKDLSRMQDTEAYSIVRLLSDEQPAVFQNRKIETVYRFVGLADCLLSVCFLREHLPYYCLPGKPGEGHRLVSESMYHPLIEDCVANSIDIQDKSVLLNGSNMSGKTTFIRIIGINVLAAQTLHTAFARTFFLSASLNIHSALMLADDLSEGKSFYMKEVDTIKDMISRSQEGITNLFLFDEIFKGTNTTERIAAAKAVLSYLNTRDNIIVASTHDTELTTLLDKEYDLYHFSEVIEGETFSFDYKLKSGPLYQRNAIRLLEINGFPSAVIRDAYRTIEGMTKQ